MLDIKSRALAALSGDSALTALLGSSDRIIFGWPDSPPRVPIIAYSERQAPRDFADDAEVSRESIIELHIFTAHAVSTTPLTTQADIVLGALGFVVDYSEDVPEPEDGYRHRLTRYRGIFTPDDLD